jgi:polar amino acid transport system substrate-binding protein
MRVPRLNSRLPVSVAALLAAVALAGCGSDSKDKTPSANSSSSAAGGLKLVKAGQLTTCTHLPYPPFQYEKDNKVVGFDVDMIDLAATALKVKQVVVDTPFETIKTGADLNAGKCDVAAAGMTITPERKQNLDFSSPYFDATQALLAKKGSGITSLATAKGKKVGSQASTTGEDYVKGKGFDPVSFETSEAELNGLKSGQVAVIVQDLPVVSGWLKDPGNANLQIVANLDTGEQYGFAVKKNGSPQLLAAINAAIAKARSDGTYDKLYAKWIGVKPAAARGTAPTASPSG